MPVQNLLVQDYGKFHSKFSLCSDCYWCATILKDPVPKACPVCNGNLYSTLLSSKVVQQEVAIH